MNGEECKALRTRLNLTQQEFADKLGVSRALIIRGENDTPSLLLSQAILGLVNQGEIERLTALLAEQAEHIEMLNRSLAEGSQCLAEEIQRLKQKNADLSKTVEVMMAVRKAAKLQLH